jgi:hypothetical protein
MGLPVIPMANLSKELNAYQRLMEIEHSLVLVKPYMVCYKFSIQAAIHWQSF